MTDNTSDALITRIKRQSPAAALTGIALLAIGPVIVYNALLYGEHALHAVYTSKYLPNVILALIALSIAAFALGVFILIALFVALAALQKIAYPRVLGHGEYTLLGIACLAGVAGTIITSLTGHVITSAAIMQHAPPGVGESLVALVAAVTPVVILGLQLVRPDVVSWQAEAAHNRENWDGYKVENEVTAVARNTRTSSESDETGDDTELSLEWYESDSNSNRNDTSERPPRDNNTVEQNSNPELNPYFEQQGNSDDGDDSDDEDSYEFDWQFETDVSFDDVGGMEETKTELRNDIIRPFVEEPERAERLGIRVSNIILHGPPGTGKTFIAKALATELGLPFAALSGADVQSKWINESPQRVKQLFSEAETLAAREGGAVIFLDELDTILRSRDDGSGKHAEDDKVVNEFLNHLEDATKNNVLFIGATNRFDLLDEAGVRSGRVDKTIEVGKPDFEARVKIFEVQLRTRPSDVQGEVVRRASKLTDGLVAADIDAIVEAAAKNAFNRGRDEISSDDFMDAVQVHISNKA